MTPVVVREMTNGTALPSEAEGINFVFAERKPSTRNRTVAGYLFLVLGMVNSSAADAFPRRSFSFDPTSDPTSATGQVEPPIVRGVRDRDFGSATRVVDPVSHDRAAYQSRITQLRSFAEEDGIELSASSERDFFDFACTDPHTKLASLVLLDNGNLRAVWRVGEQEVGVQFCGDGSVQYLISRESDRGEITHTAHRGTFGDLLETLETAGLVRLLYE